MKRALTICAVVTICIVTAAAATATDLPTVSFHVSDLDFQVDQFRAEYRDFMPIGVGSRVVLSARPVYVALSVNEGASSLAWQSVNADTIGSFDVEDPFADQLTGAAEFYADVIEQSRSVTPGHVPVQNDGTVTGRDGRYLRLLLLPVTITDNGEVVFHPDIVITVGGRKLAKDDLLDVLPENAPLMSPSVAPDIAPQYVIVTDDALAPAARRLAVYKSQTGIPARVKLIEDIVDSYPGRDDAESLREYLKDFYWDGGKYALLAGDETVVPIRYAYHYNIDTMPDINRQFICDLYFADVDGEWDADNDGVWGERSDDNPDVTAELMVGRLPFSEPGELDAYVNKLIDYETNPGGGDLAYLRRAYFFCSDQMRDYTGGGQHHQIAQAYPEGFEIDTASGVELSRGDDLQPHNLTAPELIDTLASGYGIINIVAHGRADGFVVRSAAYNEWPKSYFFTTEEGSDHADPDSLIANGKTSLYYSLACDNGAFDMDNPPLMGRDAANLVQELLRLKNTGAVAFVANTRWGWVGSSHLVQTAFYDSLFANPNRPAVAALYGAKAQYYYSRDHVYGLNYFGDPSLKIYTSLPDTMSLTGEPTNDGWSIRIEVAGSPIAACPVLICDTSGYRVGFGITGTDGEVAIDCDYSPSEGYTVAAVKDGYVTRLEIYAPMIASDVDDEYNILPEEFSLAQTYPTPFNPTTTIAFELARRSEVTLSIYNVLGQQLAVLLDQSLSPGSYDVVWNGITDRQREAASGVYFYRLTAGEFSESKKMVLLR